MNRLLKFVTCLIASVFVIAACTPTSHEFTPFSVKETTTQEKMEQGLSTSGPIHFEKIVLADWKIDLSGLLDLDHPRVKAAGIEDRKEPIQIYMYRVEHPQYGVFLLDSGIEEALSKGDGTTKISWLIRKFMNMKTLKFHTTTTKWLSKTSVKLKGVFLTHMHLDHIMGVPDMPKDIDIYVGPGEASSSSFKNAPTRGTINGLFENHKPIRQIAFSTGLSKGEETRAIWDFFGDGSFYVIEVPGHTAGSLAFIVRSTSGVHLITGDTCHTVWGWKNNVTPGAFTSDHKINAKSLDYLIQMAKRFPNLKVHLGHQSL